MAATAATAAMHKSVTRVWSLQCGPYPRSEGCAIACLESRTPEAQIAQRAHAAEGRASRCGRQRILSPSPGIRLRNSFEVFRVCITLCINFFRETCIGKFPLVN
jgi:hypothetical protein